MDYPLVSVLTPVYNGAEFLPECIESVLAQDYENWEYHILNNCSTDETLTIGQAYATKDPRIRVTTNSTFLSLSQNYNAAFRLISPQSKYCKAVAADDWLMPECLSKMVRFALAHPTVGIIGSYQRSADNVRWQDLPRTTTVLSGRDACRLALLRGVQVFGAPTAFLYRSDLLRRRKPFFPNSQPHADSSACYESLRFCDFGILHEVLAAERVHPGQASSKIEKLGAGNLAYLEVLLEYGPQYLTRDEFVIRRKEVFDAYYRFTGGCALKLRGREFWNFQSSRLRELGCELDWSRVAAAVVKEIVVEIRNPRSAARKLMSAVKDKFRGG